MGSFDQLKQRVYECNMALPKHGIVIFTFGNASAIDRQAGVVAIKPSGIAYHNLRPEDIVVLDLAGKTIDGSLRPSSDTDTHLVLYEQFPGIGGIVHTHSTYAVAWAQAARPIPLLGTTHADFLHVDVPCTDFLSGEMVDGEYERETGRQILKTFASLALSPREVEMVLVAGHGPFTWGTTPEKAVENSVVLEELAKMAYLTLTIDSGARRLSSALVKKHYQRKHGPDAYYGQPVKIKSNQSE